MNIATKCAPTLSSAKFNCYYICFVATQSVTMYVRDQTILEFISYYYITGCHCAVHGLFTYIDNPHWTETIKIIIKP